MALNSFYFVKTLIRRAAGNHPFFNVSMVFDYVFINGN
jgi:hypothetical protein